VPLPRVAVSRPWHAGFAVRGSGGGGLARRVITAATAVVVPTVVATTMLGAKLSLSSRGMMTLGVRAIF
jgi:hypothetical protein